MSKVSLLVKDFGHNKKQTVSLIRQFTSLPIGEIISRVRNGQPIFEIEMFGLDLAERVTNFRILVENLLNVATSLEMYELLSNEVFSEVDKESLVKVDLEMLMNMLRAQE